MKKNSFFSYTDILLYHRGRYSFLGEEQPNIFRVPVWGLFISVLGIFPKEDISS